MTNNPLTQLSVQQLKRALSIRQQIDRLEKEIDGLIGGQVARTRKATPTRRKKLSAAAKARISTAMKARWAKIKARK